MLRWALSLVGGGVLLWLVSHRMPLWPARLVIDDPSWLGLGIALLVPYALARAWRASAVLDPLVLAASTRPVGIRRSVLFGSGFVSFFVVFLLPFRLGELSRPAILAKAHEPGIGWPESLGMIAAERVLDGLLVCAMLFLGLAMAGHVGSVDGVDVRRLGAVMGGLFMVLAVLLLCAARRPQTVAAVIARGMAWTGPAVAPRIEEIVQRLAQSMAPLFALNRAGRFVVGSVAYWGLAVFQLWCVARSLGIPLDGGGAMAAVAIVGLAIQLPGGPAQIGSFQVGTLASLTVLAPELEPSRAASFAAVTYALQLVGTAGMAGLGLLLLATSREDGASRQV